MGPPGGTDAIGWERRTRTSTTGSRAPRPTIRRSPNASAIVSVDLRGVKATARPDGRNGSVSRVDRLQDGDLQGRARLETGDATGWNWYRLAGAGVASVPGGAAAHQKRPEAAERDAPAFLEGVEHVVDEGVERALRRDLRSTRGLRHRGDQLGLRHRFSYLLDRL